MKAHNRMEIKTLAIFHCDDCGQGIEMVTIPEEESNLFCPRCKSSNFYSFDDMKVTPVDKKKIH